MGEQSNERVGSSCYPRGDQPNYRVSALSRVVMESHHFPNQNNLTTVKGMTKACTSIEQCARPLSLSLSPQSQQVSTGKRADRTDRRSRTEHIPSETPATRVFVKRHPTLSVHFRAQNTMLPNNSVLDLWNE